MPLEQIIDVEKALKLRLRGNTWRDIGEVFGVSPQAVEQRLSRFFRLIEDPPQIVSYRECEAEFIDGARTKLLPLIIEHAETGKTRKAQELTMVFGTLFDKARILRGQSTQNIAILSRIIADADKLDEPAPAKVIEAEKEAST